MIKQLWIVATAWLGLAVTHPVCNYTVRDIGFVEFAEPRLGVVVLFSDQLDEETIRLHQRRLAEQTIDEACRSWNVTYQSGTLANLVVSTTEQQEWAAARDADWSLWLTRDDEAHWITNGNLDIPPDWQTLLTRHLEPDWIDAFRRQALEAFAHVVVFEGPDVDSNATVRDRVDATVAALKRAAGLLPRPLTGPVNILTVPYTARESSVPLLWSLEALTPLAPEPIVVTLYGRGRAAGPALRGTEWQLAELLSQVVLVGQSCECGTQRRWVNYPAIPIQWSAEWVDDLTRHLGFDPANAVVIEEVKKIVLRGPQLNVGQRDEVNDVVDAALANSTGLPGAVRATVIQGDGWDFDEIVSEQPAVEPALVPIPPGRRSESSEIRGDVSPTLPHLSGETDHPGSLAFAQPATEDSLPVEEQMGTSLLSWVAPLGIGVGLAAVLLGGTLWYRFRQSNTPITSGD